MFILIMKYLHLLNNYFQIVKVILNIKVRCLVGQKMTYAIKIVVIFLHLKLFKD